MGAFGIVPNVETTVKRAYAVVDTLGYLWCGECWTRAQEDRTALDVYELAGPYRGAWLDSTHEDNCCDRCKRNPWETRERVVRAGTVEYVACKIF